MRFRHPSQLEDKLDRALAWRKKELSTLKFSIDGASPSAKPVLLRAGTALLYAHWEGFIKEAGTTYLRFIADQPLELGKLSPNVLAIVMAPRILECGRSRKTTLYIQLVQRLRAAPAEKAQLKWRGVVRTRSNLKSDVLREIVETLGLDFKPFEPKCKPVIDRVVKARNGIAHGTAIPVDGDEYARLHSEVVSLLDEFKDQLENAATARAYLGPS